MGSSKKHKEKDREHKHKRRHRSRDRSHERSRSGSTSRKRKSDHHERRERDDEKRRKRDASPTEDDYRHAAEEVGETAIEGSKTTEASVDQKRVPSEDKAELSATGGLGLSLGIDETNKLRISLGLKPLTSTETKQEDGTIKGGDGDNDVHAPPTNMSEVKRSEELREKMLQMKEKRRLNMLLGKVKTLANESDDEDSAAAWVKKSRKIELEKQKAQQMSKMLDAMDNEFGLGDLVAEEFSEKKKKYNSKDLKGLRVEHAQDGFVEGRSTILVLKDRGILDEEKDEDAVDTLINMNMVDDERAAKNNETKKKKPDYKPYDEPEFDEYGMLKPKDILDKYDEEIDGVKKESFQLGGGGRYDAEHERRMYEIRNSLRQQGETLSLPPPRIASEYYTHEDMASFKKIRKKPKSVRKKAAVVKADDLLKIAEAEERLREVQDHGSRRRIRESSPTFDGTEEFEESVKEEIKMESVQDADGEPKPLDCELIPSDMDLDDDDDNAGRARPDQDLSRYVIEEDSASRELELALNKARRLQVDKRPPVSLPRIKVEEEEDEDDEALPFKGQDFEASSIVLYSTSEFCRSLGDIPTYGQAGNRGQDEEEMMAYELEQMSKSKTELDDEEQGTGAWQKVEIDTRPVEIVADDKPVLDDEPVLTGGLASALKLASTKGYLDNKVKVINPKHSAIEAQNYSIEDKRLDDNDDKLSRKGRERYTGGMTMDFKEKEGYKPDIKLEYVDEKGRAIPPKEAFRALSHRFHGKGSGKKKTEKRMKKMDEEQLMKSMSSTDTPLNTVHLLKEKQKANRQPYVILSGGKGYAALWGFDTILYKLRPSSVRRKSCNIRDVLGQQAETSWPAGLVQNEHSQDFRLMDDRHYNTKQHCEVDWSDKEKMSINSSPLV